MLKRPSSRTRRLQSGFELNLVPILDSLITLISFLMLSMSLLSIVSIESPFPIVSREDVEQKLNDPKEKPLQLTVSMRDNGRGGELEIWSPFERIRPQTIPNRAEGQPDTQLLHEKLIEIKKQFPDENKVVIVPTAQTDYDSLIVLMDAMRILEQSDPPIFRRNPETGNDEPVKALFPEVVFGNLLGDS